jgi:Tol biopolymer transport system component
MPPLTLGNHQNIVYIVNEYQGHNPTFGTLKRYDVTTGQKTEILKLPNVEMSDAQISADGQWIVFQVSVGGTEKLQLIRMDGQELQTLYCGNPVSYTDLQWSANQQLIAFATTG